MADPPVSLGQASALTDSPEALKVNWLEVRITDAQSGQMIYHNAWITDWELNAANVAEFVAAGRARWKIENENNNVLKTKGYHLKHNFGHGKEHLSSLLATMNILAFALHTLLDLVDQAYRRLRQALATRAIFFEHIRALSTYVDFKSWERLMGFMIRKLALGSPPPTN